MKDTVVFELDYLPEEMPVEKDAKIFEAGEYPDKGIEVSEADLDAIIGSFEEVPVKVEHVDSPLDPLGTVKRIWRQGKDLFARLAFPRDLAAFLERRGVKKLSVALQKDPLRLAEVSLVLSPRVPSAAMFGQPPSSFAKASEDKAASSQPDSHPHPNPLPPAGERTGGTVYGNLQLGGEVSELMSHDERDKEIAELRFALRSKDVEAKLAELKAQGKIVPASEQYAREILLQGDGTITFGEGESTIAQMFECFLESQPKVITFGELAPGTRMSSVPLSAEEEELLEKLGITQEQIEQYAR